MLDAAEILKRHKAALTRKDQWRDMYEEAYEFALPQRNLYDGYYEGMGGRRKMQRVFDSTAINSTQKFANRLQSGLFPPGRHWMRLEAGSDVPEELRPQVQEILDDYTQKFFAVLRQTNFDLAMGEFLLDLVVGTGAMLVQAGDEVEPIRFSPVPQFLIAIEEGPHGAVDNVFRRHRLRSEVIKTRWPDAKLPEEIERKVEDKPSEDVSLVEALIYNYDERSYEYYVLLEKQKTVIVQRNLKDGSPWVVARYMKVAGEVYGRGPLISAMPDIKTLNKVLEYLLKNASISIAGVWTAADDGVLNPQTIRIQPGTVIPVARNGGPQGPSISRLDSAADINLTQIVINDLRMSIKQMLLDTSLPPDNMSARSATEVVERMNELAQNLGSAFGRLITEAMIPIVRSTLRVMQTRGLIELPLNVNGLEVKVTPVSPIAKAQAMDEINDIVNYTQIAAAFGPEGQMSIKPSEAAQMVGDKMGIPQRIRRTPEEIAEAVQQMQEAAAQAAEQQGGAPMMEAAQ